MEHGPAQGQDAAGEHLRRIAGELHDGVLQSLYVAGMSVQLAEDSVDRPDELRARLQKAVEHIDSAIDELRTYISRLA